LVQVQLFMDSTLKAQLQAQRASEERFIQMLTATTSALAHPQNTYKPTAALTGLVFEGTPGTIDIIEFWEAAEERLTLHRVTDAATQVREWFWVLKGSAKAAVGAQWSDPAECSLEELK
jgi:hypothetical protein